MQDKQSTMEKKPQSIIFYDGHCNLCNRVLQFIIRRDKKRIFQYLPLQSKEAGDLLSLKQSNNQNPDSVILLENNKIYSKTEAIYRILPKLGQGYKLLLVFKLIPNQWTDSVYDWIAANRYQWFGKSDDCKLY